MASPRPSPRQRSQALEAWFGRAARDLPWRHRGRGAGERGYRVWVSEIMLQQTQVKTVVPYYLRWLERFPTLEALAGAREEAVLEAWAGLGYYRRARNLHRAARQVLEEQGGRLPRSAEALQALPGIGRYSAGAIASLAFGERSPIVDGNVARVLARLEGLAGDPRRPPLEPRLWALAGELVEAAGHPGRLNEALMELGALVCTPRSPACELCPLAAGCAAHRSGEPTRFPDRSPAPRRKQALATCGLIQDRRGALLLARRRPGLLGGLWEPPQLARVPGGLVPRGEVRHVFTHLELTLRVVQGSIARRDAHPPLAADLYEATAWSRAPEELPLSALARKALALV
ncbi:MAG: A/G-specific adenine glycosylase [Deltaproteobacteria bacterium]|nr:A/G-specific adenine glycosylase [Deltaproteobacteria bacterium]